MDTSIDTIDFRLLDIDLELSALNYHLDLLEKQIRNIQAFERLSLEKRIKKLGYTPADPEWQIVQSEFDYTIEFWVPRVFRAPFIVSLYAVYESGVTEIANLIQKKKKIESSITDKNRHFNLDRAKDYYNDIVEFMLYSDDVAWERIKMLSVIRHAFAHANGRVEILSDKIKAKIAGYEKRKVGIFLESGFIVIEEGFLRETFKLVSASLNDLVERYKKWDDNQNSSQQGAILTQNPKPKTGF
jgi:hypothetical protein